MIFKKLSRPLIHGKESIENLIGTKDISPRPIFNRLMVILSVMALIGTIGSGILLIQQQRHFMNDSFKIRIDDVYGNFQKIISLQASGLALAIEPIAADERVKQSLRAGDRERLLNDWQGVFETMKKENYLTHFYFLRYCRGGRDARTA